MPAQVAITIKKFDGTTDIVYDVLQPSGGDGTWAKWRQDTGNSLPMGLRPQLWVKTTESGAGIRRVELRYDYPHAYTDTTTSLVQGTGKSVSFRNGSLAAPQDVPAAIMNEAVAQFANLVNHVHIRAGLLSQTSYF